MFNCILLSSISGPEGSALQYCRELPCVIGCPKLRVCVCVRVCVCAYRPFALEVGCCTQLCGLICRPLVCVMCALCSGSLVLYVAVRTYCLAPRSGSLVLDALVRTYVLALCSANLVLHAAVRTYCPHFCACDVSPRVCVCVCACAPAVRC